MSGFYPVEIEIKGRVHRGQWTLRQGCKLCVGGFYGSQAVDLGDAPTTARAREVLRDLVLSWEQRSFAPQPPVRRRLSPEERPKPIRVQVGGKGWGGEWRLPDGEVLVGCAYGERSAPLKRSTPERVPLPPSLMKKAAGGRPRSRRVPRLLRGRPDAGAFAPPAARRRVPLREGAAPCGLLPW